jgi:hypothetical protein
MNSIKVNGIWYKGILTNNRSCGDCSFFVDDTSVKDMKDYELNCSLIANELAPFKYRNLCNVIYVVDTFLTMLKEGLDE